MKNKRHVALITAVSLTLTLIFSFPVFADISPYEKPVTEADTKEYAPGEAIICICPEVTDEKRIAVASAGLFSIAPEIESDFLMDVSNAARSIEEEKGEGFKGFPSGGAACQWQAFSADRFCTSGGRALRTDRSGAETGRRDAVADRRLMRAYITPEINFLSGQRDTSSTALRSPFPRGEGSAVLKLVRSDSLSTEELIELYSGKPGVLFAEPNYIIKPEFTKDNDPFQENKLLRSSSEDSKSPDLTTLTQYAFGDGPGGINVPDWNDPSNKNAEGVVVAVVDTGVDYTHEDLKNVMWDEGLNIAALKKMGGGKYGFNPGYDDYVGEEGKGEKDDPMDSGGHGTHCAGIIAAEWNGFGTSGAANGARIMAIKHVINNEGTSLTSSTLKGFQYIRTAKDNGVNVAAVNCSYCGPDYSMAERYGIIELCKDDIVVCASTSNDHTNNDILPYTPCGFTDLPQLIAVNSMDKNGRPSSFSNYGKRSTHLFSPGSNIMSTYPNSVKELLLDKDISRPVKDTSGNEVYDSFDSNDPSDNYFNYEAAADSSIKFEDGELKFSGETALYKTPGGNTLRHVFTFRTSLPDPPPGEEYNLIFKSRISDEGLWFPEIFTKNKEGKDCLLSKNYLSLMVGDYSYIHYAINGEDIDFSDLEMKFCIIDFSESADFEKPIEEISFDEIWITDAEMCPYSFQEGTSMATPAVAGEVAILAAKFPEDSASKRVARILAGTKPADDLKDLCITGGKANVANALDKNTYTPVINSIKAENDGLHIKGFFFGTKDHTDVTISQGSSTWSVSGKTLELLDVKGSEDDAGDIILKIPGGMKNEEVCVTVTDRGKEKGRQSFEGILTPEDPEGRLEKGNFYERLPVSETGIEYLRTVDPQDACALNGSLYFQGTNPKDNTMDTLSFKDGGWRKPEDLISTVSRIMAWNGMLVYFCNGRLVFHDGNRIVTEKEFIPEKTETEETEDMKWVLTPPDEDDVRFDFYYDGKDALLIRNREEKDENGYVCDCISAVYRLDPESGRGSYIGKLENYYKGKIVIAHEERPDSPNTFYFLGRGSDAEGNQKDFIAEKATLDPFKTEAIDNIKPKDCRINEDREYWTGCGVRNGIYLAGGRAVRENAGIESITADNFFFDYSKPQDGFVPCDKRICDTPVSPVAAVAAYGKVYFLGFSDKCPVMCYTEADTLPQYGDTPEKKIDYSDPASPLHLTDGSDVEKLSTDNARYVVTLSSNTAVIGGTKADISSFFEAAPGFDSSAKHRYKSSIKKTAKVNKKGILTAKKKGETEITCEQKVKGGSWEPLGEKMHLFVQLPEMVKKQDVSADTAGLSAYSFISKTTYSPTMWRSTNTKVATVDENGNITILKPGRTNIIAEYGEGKTGSKKKYKTKLKVG